MLRRFFVSSFVPSSSIALALALGASGCGSSHPRNTFESGLPDDRSVGSLSRSEFTQLCEESQSFFRDAAADGELRRSVCLYQVLVSAGASLTPESCESAVAECVDEPSMPPAADCSMAPLLSECDATVSDYEVCLTDQVNAYPDAAAGLDCSLAGSPELEAELADREVPELPASCATITSDPGCVSTTPSMAGG